MNCPAAHAAGRGGASLWGGSGVRVGGTFLSCPSWGPMGPETMLALRGCLVLKLDPSVMGEGGFLERSLWGIPGRGTSQVGMGRKRRNLGREEEPMGSNL